MTEWQSIDTAPKEGTVILLHTFDADITPYAKRVKETAET
jgi:hypothetical protein